MSTTANIDLDQLFSDLFWLQDDIALSLGEKGIEYVTCHDDGTWRDVPTEAVVPIATIREWCDRLDKMAMTVQEA